MPRDDFKSSLQPLQRPGTRQLSLWENTDDLTSLNLRGSAADRFTRTRSIDRDRPHHAQNRVQNSISVKFLIDNETDWPRATELEHDRVNPCDVIRHE